MSRSSKKNYYVHLCPKTPRISSLHVKRKLGGGSLLRAHEDVPGKLQDQHLIHTSNVREYNYINHDMRHFYVAFIRTGSTSTTPCAATTRYPAVAALRQPRRAP
jgi:hypothetical protein